MRGPRGLVVGIAAVLAAVESFAPASNAAGPTPSPVLSSNRQAGLGALGVSATSVVSPKAPSQTRKNADKVGRPGGSSNNARPLPAALSNPEWLTVVNLYRATAVLPPVLEDHVASSGAKAHSAYLVKNRTIGHTESAEAPGYSAAGVRAGATGNVASGTGRVADERLTVEGWMTAPFHALSLLDPAATSYGCTRTPGRPSQGLG